jgi:hypothetical protein
MIACTEHQRTMPPKQAQGEPPGTVAKYSADGANKRRVEQTNTSNARATKEDAP